MKISGILFVEKVDFNVTVKFLKTLIAIRSATVDNLFSSVHSCWTGLHLLTPGHTVDTCTSDTYRPDTDRHGKITQLI